MNSEFSTPILLNLFNRPQETRQVLEKLRLARVPSLYIHVDGARPSCAEDEPLVSAVKRLVSENIIWNCDVHTFFEDRNYGCGLGPARAISWFFDNVEEGIILEDDCIPHPDFFMYAQQLLEKYRYTNEIGIISGANLRQQHVADSYCFSAYAGIWGWATWKRVWQLYDFNINYSDNDFIAHVKPFLKSTSATNYWLKQLQSVRADANKSYWDYQLHIIMLYNNKIHIRPSVNLISNIGFNSRANHTTVANHPYANLPTFNILPLRHPSNIKINHNLDNAQYKLSINKRIKQMIKRFISKL